MVGLLGCGCCGGCCSNGTTTWIEPFSTTPTGQPYDTITNIDGTGCRSSCPPPSTQVGYGNQYLKTSTLAINGDNSSPLYLGLNGTPTGGRFTAGWRSSTNASQWGMMLPPDILTKNYMGFAIKSELSFKFETFTFYSGSTHSCSKSVYQDIMGGYVYEYTRSSAGYFRINNGINSPEYTVYWYTAAPPSRMCDWDVEDLYTPDYKVLGGTTCKLFYEIKRAIENTSGEAKKNLAPPQYLPKGSPLPPSPETFQCFVGWESSVTWYTSTAYGIAGEGAFDFKGEYVSWKPAAWNPYP